MISKILVCGMASLILSSCVNIAGSEQSIATTEARKISPPSSLPPEGYLSNKWVDSRGCNYLNSNSGAWVPQVTQKGSHLCTGMPIAKNAELKDTTIAHGSETAHAPTTNLEAPSAPVPINSNALENTFRAAVQIGAYAKRGNIERIVRELTELGYEFEIQKVAGGLHSIAVFARNDQRPHELLNDMRERGFQDAFYV